MTTNSLSAYNTTNVSAIKQWVESTKSNCSIQAFMTTEGPFSKENIESLGTVAMFKSIGGLHSSSGYQLANILAEDIRSKGLHLGVTIKYSGDRAYLNLPRNVA